MLERRRTKRSRIRVCTAAAEQIGALLLDSQGAIFRGPAIDTDLDKQVVDLRVEAGILELEDDDRTTDVFFTLTLQREFDQTGDECRFVFEGVSDANLDIFASIILRFGKAEFRAPVRHLTPHKLQALISVPQTAVINARKRVVNAPITLQLIA